MCAEKRRVVAAAVIADHAPIAITRRDPTSRLAHAEKNVLVLAPAGRREGEGGEKVAAVEVREAVGVHKVVPQPGQRRVRPLTVGVEAAGGPCLQVVHKPTRQFDEVGAIALHGGDHRRDVLRGVEVVVVEVADHIAARMADRQVTLLTDRQMARPVHVCHASVVEIAGGEEGRWGGPGVDHDKL